ncbi:hypothetical protein A200_07614 [Parascardovia denticolens IPLA 20019]|uniref:hypothetical protein n=1 Tax=Parascardovia denticolens TaxID=78258 RepID=UPI0002669871|nr:hypothetical protein [Parascardovia denticolens]EIT87651.1 hypothetical protein A200_07614 [Parascardovia denticolens IPLA 20019]
MRSKDEDDGWWDDTQADKIWKEFGKESTAPLSEKTLTLVYEDFASMLCQGPLETILYKRQ